MTAIAQVLERAGHTTFLPHRDGLEAYLMRFDSAGFPGNLAAVRERMDAAVFALDAYELLECCQAVVCNLNGRVPDEGMIVEASLAYSMGVPVVLYKNDARAPFGGYDNSMLTALAGGHIVRNLSALPAELQAASDRRGAVPGTASAQLRAAVDYGKRIAALMARLPASAGRKQWTPEVVEQVLAAAQNQG